MPRRSCGSATWRPPRWRPGPRTPMRRSERGLGPPAGARARRAGGRARPAGDRARPAPGRRRRRATAMRRSAQRRRRRRPRPLRRWRRRRRRQRHPRPRGRCRRRRRRHRLRARLGRLRRDRALAAEAGRALRGCRRRSRRATDPSLTRTKDYATPAPHRRWCRVRPRRAQRPSQRLCEHGRKGLSRRARHRRCQIRSPTGRRWQWDPPKARARS